MGSFHEMEWLVTDVTAVVYPERAERGIFEVILGIFWPIQASFVAGEPVCVVGIPS